MYRVVARLVLSDGTVCGYRLKDMSTGQEGNMDKVTAWQYAKAGYIQDVKSTGSIGSGNIGLSGTNGFELKALPSIKKGSTGKIRLSETKKNTLEVNPDTVRSGWIGADSQRFSARDIDAAFVRALLRGEADSRIVNIRANESYYEVMATIKHDALKKSMNNGEIQQDTFKRCSDKIVVTTALCNGYNLSGGIVVGYEVVNNSNECFSIPRLSKDGPSQTDTITLTPGGKAFVNRAEIAALASDCRISFKLGDDAIMSRDSKVEKFSNDPNSWEGKYNYLSCHFLARSKEQAGLKPLRKVEVKQLFDKETVEKYYMPINNQVGTDKIYTIAVEYDSSTPAKNADYLRISKEADIYDYDAAITRDILNGNGKKTIDNFTRDINTDRRSKDSFEKQLASGFITGRNFRALSPYIKITRIIGDNTPLIKFHYLGAEVVNTYSDNIEVLRIRDNENDPKHPFQDAIALEPGKPVLLNREEMARLASRVSISNRFSNCKLTSNTALLSDAIRHPGNTSEAVREYLRGNFLVASNNKAITSEEANLDGAKLVYIEDAPAEFNLSKEELNLILDINKKKPENLNASTTIPDKTIKTSTASNQDKPKNGIFGMFKR